LDIYPGLIILVRALSLADAILLTIFAAFSWGLFHGGAIAFATILLALLLVHILQNPMTTLISKHLKFFNKYFSWTKILGRLAAVGDEPQIGSEHELIYLVEQGDFLDDQTKMLLKNAIAFRDQTVSKIMVSRDRIIFVHSRDDLMPKLLDELFTSGHKVFPVAQGSLDHTVGLLYLDDVLPIEQEEKILTKTMRKCPPPIDQGAPLESALNQMCEYHSTALMVAKNDKIVGLVLLKDIVRTLFSVVE
jgi:CBS domain containing-hemolysin-like protein